MLRPVRHGLLILAQRLDQESQDHRIQEQDCGLSQRVSDYPLNSFESANQAYLSRLIFVEFLLRSRSRSIERGGKSTGADYLAAARSRSLERRGTAVTHVSGESLNSIKFAGRATSFTDLRVPDRDGAGNNTSSVSGMRRSDSSNSLNGLHGSRGRSNSLRRL